MVKACEMCNNARIDDDLIFKPIYSAIPIGNAMNSYRMIMCYRHGKPPRIEVEKYDYDHGTGWYRVADYEPKYCPNCGRKIVE